MMTPSGARHDAGLQEQPTINTSGPVRLAGAVEGALAGGWVGPRFQITVAADAPIESIAVHGYLPYQRDGGVRFTVTANGQVITRVETEKGLFVWPIPCRAGPAEPITLTIEAERPFVPAAEGSRDRRQLGFVLKEVVFLPAPVPTAIPGNAGVSHVAVCSDPVIIAGSPRSGTSILAWSLSQHGQLWLGPESDLLWALFGKGRLHQVFEAATEQPHQLLRQERIDEEEFGRWAVLGINALLTAHSGGRRWIEQSPSNTAALSHLASALPHAQFVHMLRDGRRVVHSMIHSRFDRPWASDFTLACEAWRNNVQGTLRFAEDNPGRCLTVANEELVQDPEAGFRTIQSFLHLEEEAGPAAYFRSTRLNSSFSHLGQRSEEPWEQWTDEQRDTFDHIAGPLLDDLYARGLLVPIPDRPRTGSRVGTAAETVPEIGDDVVLSTILLSYNRADLLELTLESYLATVSVPYELIIIDNNSTDSAREVIAAYREGRPNHHAILLDENRGGEALNDGIAAAQGAFIHISENDLEYLPGWDRHLLSKFEAFPELGQLSVSNGGNNPQERVQRNGITIGVTDRNVVSSCIARREVYERGVRWHTRGRGEFRPPADGRFSSEVRALGYLTAWDDETFVINHGWDPDEIASRLDYYVANSRLKTGGTSWVAKHLRRGGYRLVQDAEGHWRAEKVSINPRPNPENRA